MIGIIQKVLVDLLVNTGGTELKQAVFARAGVPLDRNFRIDQNYPDDECLRLIHAAVAETGLPAQQIYTLYAKAFLQEAKSLFPRFFEISTSSEAFLMRQATIHAVMASGLQHSVDRKKVTDKFSATQLAPGSIQIEYRSANLLCGIFKALAHELAGFYNESLTVSCARCVKRGDGECCFVLQWPYAANKNTSADIIECG
ncbi:MAG: heme NO-binding protein [Paraglaciecola sp.]|nr:heme NO-binding protein [Paraglaciecola sp.]NCT47751.1 heme NO-binding protein [Paraglaciecola sp.]